MLRIKNILHHIPPKVLISDVMDGPTIIYVEDHPMLMSMNQKFRTMMLIVSINPVRLLTLNCQNCAVWTITKEVPSAVPVRLDPLGGGQLPPQLGGGNVLGVPQVVHKLHIG